MTCFLTISVGDSADDARPLLASTDSKLVRHAIRGCLGIIDRDDRGEPQSLELLAQADAAEYQWSDRDVAFELERADSLEGGAATGERSVLVEELLDLATWHRARARAIAVLIQQRDDGAGGSAFVAVRRRPDGSLYVVDPPASADVTLPVQRQPDGSLALVEPSSVSDAAHAAHAVEG